MLLESVLAAGVLLLETDNLFHTDSRLDRDNDRILASIPGRTNVVSEAIRVRGKIEISLLVAAFIHESEFVSFDINELPFGLLNKGNSGSVGRRNHVFVLLAGENVSGNKVTLGVTVLSGLGDRNGEDLARVALDHHVAV